MSNITSIELKDKICLILTVNALSLLISNSLEKLVVVEKNTVNGELVYTAKSNWSEDSKTDLIDTMIGIRRMTMQEIEITIDNYMRNSFDNKSKKNKSSISLSDPVSVLGFNGVNIGVFKQNCINTVGDLVNEYKINKFYKMSIGQVTKEMIVNKLKQLKLL